MKKLRNLLARFFSKKKSISTSFGEIPVVPLSKENFYDRNPGSLGYYYQQYQMATLSASTISTNRINWALDKAIKNKGRYESVQSMTGVPWYVVAAIHCRESSFNWATCLHNGQPLNQMTTIVPKGLGPWSSWEEAAVDALKRQGCDSILYWTLESALKFCEEYNGLGYLKYHPSVKSPYIWACTNLYQRGKYVADGKFNPDAIDEGVGVAALIKAIELKNEVKLQFSEPGLLAKI